MTLRPLPKICSDEVQALLQSVKADFADKQAMEDILVRIKNRTLEEWSSEEEEELVQGVSYKRAQLFAQVCMDLNLHIPCCLLFLWLLTKH